MVGRDALDVDLLAPQVPALAERLGETGEVMGRIADEYRDADDAAATGLAAAYTSATGDWSAE